MTRHVIAAVENCRRARENFSPSINVRSRCFNINGEFFGLLTVARIRARLYVRAADPGCAIVRSRRDRCTRLGEIIRCPGMVGIRYPYRASYCDPKRFAPGPTPSTSSRAQAVDERDVVAETIRSRWKAITWWWISRSPHPEDALCARLEGRGRVHLRGAGQVAAPQGEDVYLRRPCPSSAVPSHSAPARRCG